MIQNQLRVHLYRESYHFCRKIWPEFLWIRVFHGLDFIFSQIIVGNDVFGSPNHYESEKCHFFGFKPDSGAPKPSKTAKNHENATKMTETTSRRCGGKVGTKSVFTKKKFWKNHPRGKNWKNIFSVFGVFWWISQKFQKISKFIFIREEFFSELRLRAT